MHHRRTNVGVENIEKNGGPAVPVRQSRQLRRLSESLMESEIGPILIFLYYFCPLTLCGMREGHGYRFYSFGCLSLR